MASQNRPPPGNIALCWLGRAFMALARWRVSGAMPDGNKLVVIAAPHTSNWDFVYLLGAAFSLRVRIRWLGKQALFRPPFGIIMRALGGIPVDRSRSTNLVAQLTERFARSSHLVVVIPPSGTRSRAGHWKSGFYWTAHQSGAKVVCGFLDYPSRTAGLGYAFHPSGRVAEDMHAVRRFYRDKTGKYPRNESEVRLKEEQGTDPC